eukprot:1150214-Pelagomonas_calceolata.AAC.3
MDIRMRSRIGCGPLPTCLLACASLTAPFLMRALELMNRGSLSNPVLIIWKGLRLSSSPSVELSLKLSEHHFCPVQITPPPRYLGTYALPPLTHNNDEIEIEGQGTYVYFPLCFMLRSVVSYSGDGLPTLKRMEQS